MAAKSYRDLEVWQQAMLMVEAIYRQSVRSPAEERFGLLSQIRRAAVSVPANIAEGYARVHRAEYVHHLSIAQGSIAEIETLLAIAARLGYVKRAEALPVWTLLQQIGKMLRQMIVSLRRRGRLSDPRP